jgi:hypothetical protein
VENQSIPRPTDAEKTLRTFSRQVRLLHGVPILSRPGGSGSFPPKELCDCSTQSRETILLYKHRRRCNPLVRERRDVRIVGGAPICPVSIAGDAAVLYTEDTAFDSPTGLQLPHKHTWRCTPFVPVRSGFDSYVWHQFGFLAQWQQHPAFNRSTKVRFLQDPPVWRVKRSGIAPVC